MNIRNIIALVLIIISLICLYPGLTFPIMSIHIGAKLPLVGTIGLHDSTQSIMKTIETLNKNGNALVAGLILFFSVIIPIIKASILLVILFVKKLKSRALLHKVVKAISKWSMADVFVVGVFLAFLATQSDDNIDAKLHEGFYYFLAYCIISITASQIMKIETAEN